MTRVCLVAAAAPLLAWAAVSASTQATFRTATRTVPVLATVTDPTGRIVPDLSREDFDVYDGGRRQEITLFDNSAQPVSVVVMLDTSGSMTLHLDLLRQAAAQFLSRLLPDDRARIGSFSARDRIRLNPPGFTGDRDTLLETLRGDLQFGNPTALWDAAGRSIDALTGATGRRVLLLFTDGADTDSRTNLRGVLARARRDELMVYAIGLRASLRGQGVTQPDPGLRRIADETGGGYFELQRSDELDATFARVAQELHSQYLLGFAPETLDGKVHTLDVRVRRPGLTVRFRKSYVAK